MVKTYYRVTPLTKEELLTQLKELNFIDYVEDDNNPFVYCITHDRILFFRLTNLWSFQYTYKTNTIDVWTDNTELIKQSRIIPLWMNVKQWVPIEPMDMATLIALYA